MTETIGEATTTTSNDLFPDERLATTGALLEANTMVGAAIDKLAVEPAGLDPSMADLLVGWPSRRPAASVASTSASGAR